MGNYSEKTGILSSIQSAVLEPILLAVSVLVLTVSTDSLTPAFLGTALMVYFISYGAFMMAGRKRISRVVRMYHDNLFYINCKDYLSYTLKVTLLITSIVAFLLIVFNDFAAKLLTANSKTGLALYPAALSLPLTAASGVLAGFNEGMHRAKRVAASDTIYAVLSAAVFVAAGFFGYRYGAKIDALLYTNDCAGAYAALFALAAMLPAGFFRLLFHMLTARKILKKLSPLHETGKPKYLGEKSLYLKSSWPLMCVLSAIPLLLLSASAILASTGHEDTTALLGLFYGHYLPYVAVLGLIGAVSCCRQTCLLFSKSQAEDGNIKVTGEYIPALIHLQSIVSFPIGTFLMALAPCIDGGLFLLKNKTAESLLTLGGFAASFLSLGIVLGLLMVLSKRLLPLFFSSLAGVIVAILAMFLTTSLAGRDVYGFVALLLSGGLIFNVIAIVMLKLIFALRGRSLFLMMTKPFVSAGLAALLISLISTGLKYVIGEIPACVICVFAGACFYLIILSFSRGIDQDELKMIPGGKFLEKISARTIARRSDNHNDYGK